MRILHVSKKFNLKITSIPMAMDFRFSWVPFISLPNPYEPV